MFIARVPTPEDLIGTYRRFGAFGPVYEVTGLLERLPDGDVLMGILVPETGERTEYNYSAILEDPKAD